MQQWVEYLRLMLFGYAEIIKVYLIVEMVIVAKRILSAIQILIADDQGMRKIHGLGYQLEVEIIRTMYLNRKEAILEQIKESKPN